VQHALTLGFGDDARHLGSALHLRKPTRDSAAIEGKSRRRERTMLTAAELEHYRRDGFVVPDFRLPPETIAAIRRDHDRLIAAHPEFVDYCPSVLAYDLAFLNYARIPAIVDMVEQVLGPDFALWNSSFFAKPAMKGRRTPWHQDGEYWPIRPVATCTVWIAVDDSTRENGCLRVIRGSHRARRLLRHGRNDAKDLTLNQELEPAAYDEREAVDIVLEAGQVSLHDVFLVHGSEPNLSAKPRRGMTLRFMPTSSVFDRELARRQVEEKQLKIGHQDRTLFMRGGDRSGRNDFRLRL
jgi:ectoine hydroxylase-related dioxygenase (phytanoyl-CoA dioxygenase family)